MTNRVFLTLTEDEYSLLVWSLEQMWLDFNPQEEQDAHNAITKLREMTDFVPVKEVAHVHRRSDLDSL